MNITDCPIEAVNVITEYLSLNEILALSTTCTTLRDMIDVLPFWRGLVEQRFCHRYCELYSFLPYTVTFSDIYRFECADLVWQSQYRDKVRSLIDENRRTVKKQIFFSVLSIGAFIAPPTVLLMDKIDAAVKNILF